MLKLTMTLTLLAVASLAIPNPDEETEGSISALHELKSHELQKRAYFLQYTTGCQSGLFTSHYKHQSGAKEIRFPKRFHKKPHLVYGIMQYDDSNRANTRIRIYVSSLTNQGFTLHFRTWSNSYLYSVGVSWMACP